MEITRPSCATTTKYRCPDKIKPDGKILAIDHIRLITLNSIAEKKSKKITPDGYPKLCCSIWEMPKVNDSKRDVDIQLIESMRCTMFRTKEIYFS